jgi:hypothetical protein
MKYEAGTFIYNVLAIHEAEILILLKALDTSSDSRYRVTIQVFQHGNMVSSYTEETCGGQSGMPYFKTDDYFTLVVCKNLYIYNGLKGRMGVYADSDPYGIVYIRGDSVYREFSPGFGQQGAGTQIDISTLQKVRDYSIEKMYLPDVFGDVQDIELKPADLNEKRNIILKYRNLTGLKFWGES